MPHNLENLSPHPTVLGEDVAVLISHGNCFGPPSDWKPGSSVCRVQRPWSKPCEWRWRPLHKPTLGHLVTNHNQRDLGQLNKHFFVVDINHHKLVGRVNCWENIYHAFDRELVCWIDSWVWLLLWNWYPCHWWLCWSLRRQFCLTHYSSTLSNKTSAWASPVVVKLRSRSRLGEGQVRVRKVKETKDLDLRYTIFLVFSTHPPGTLFWL